MEKMKRRDFLRITATMTAMVMMGGLTGCRKSTEELMVGDWYLEGDDRLQFTIYDDGTCQIREDYGQGKWSVVNKDTLKLVDFYGQVTTYPISSIDKDSLTIELPSKEKITYYHTAEEALKH